MSDAVFPVLPGLAWEVTKSPEWSTRIQSTYSGQETRLALMNYPQWRMRLSYELLRADASNELQTLMGFFNQRQGAFDSFLYKDPDDHHVAQELFGTGNGSQLTFQLVRSYGGFVEPILNLDGEPQIFVEGELHTTVPRTNKFLYSQRLENSAWSKTNASIGTNVVTAPDGSVSAEKLVETTGVGVTHGIFQNAGGTAGVPFTVSFYAKALERTKIEILAYDGTNSYARVFNLAAGESEAKQSDGSVIDAGTSGSSINAIGDGWFRCSVTHPAASSTTMRSGQVRLSVGPTVTYTGDGTSGVLLWGGQLETGTTATGYLATEASPVTRADYTLGKKGVVTFSTPPTAGAALTWSGNFYYRVRFADDAAEFNQFMHQLWELKQVSLVSVKS